MVEIPQASGKNLNDVQRLNRSLILGLLEKSEVCSRAELAKKSGLQQATITNIINDFLNWGIVVETGIISGKKGRRSIGVALNASRCHIVGVRLTRKFFRIGLFDLKGSVHYTETIEVDPHDSPRLVLQNMLHAVRRYMVRFQSLNIIAIGVAVPGPYLKKQGRMFAIVDFPGWNNICLRDEFEKEFAIPIIVDHDAKAGALAEWWISPDARDKNVIVYMALGQGLGAGILNNGRILYGQQGIAGEIGHTKLGYDIHAKGHGDCLTNHASTTCFLEAIRKRQKAGEIPSLSDHFTLLDVFQAIEIGEPLVLEEYRRLVDYYGLAVENVIWCYNPDIIVLGDEMTALGDRLVSDLKENILKSVPSIFLEGLEIKITSLGEDPAFVGTAALAIEYAIRNPDILSKII